MSLERVKEIANAVLYEGYLLYPYRRSAIKNRQRWTFGVVYPREYSEANGGIEPCEMQTECLLVGMANTSLDVHVRFLHLLVRSIEQPEDAALPSSSATHSGEWSLASQFVGEPRQEGMEREVVAPGLAVSELVKRPYTVDFSYPGERIVETTEVPPGALPAKIIREQYPLQGVVTIAAQRLDSGLFKLTVRIANATPGTNAIGNQGNAIMLHSLISTHTILQVRHGAFISLLDPPETMREAAQQCTNIHTWPVLAGNEGDYDAVLSSPIILYDYPQIAPESPGSLFDGTEIDEILTLRIMTLTEEEKAAMRQEDERVREILERTEHLTPEDLMKLHGTIRSLRPLDEEAAT
jgi:hydrogenase maturation protease